jgi:hypothetical protein
MQRHSQNATKKGKKKKRLSSIIKHLGAQAAQTNRTTLEEQNH